MREDCDMDESTNENLVDVDSYRKLVKNFINLRRYNTALFWSEKVAVLSNFDPKDVYLQAQCMFALQEYHRAAYTIRNRQLDKTNLLCHYLAAECLAEAKEYQEALDVLNSVDCDVLANNVKGGILGDASEEPDKNDVLSSIYFLKGKILEAMDNRVLAMDCYVQALHKSVYCTEALDALVQHEMLMAWEEKELMQHLPLSQQCSDAEAKILKRLYESKLKKYYELIAPTTNAEQTPVGCNNTSNILHEFTEKMKNNKNTDIKMQSSSCFTPVQMKIMSPANKILNDLKNTPSFSIQSSLSKVSMSENTSKAETPYRLNRPLSTSRTAMSLQSSIDKLENSVDMAVAKAEKLFYNSDYKKCMKIIEEILKKDPYHKRSLTVQIGCLMEMKDFNKLFYVAHKLVDLYPEDAISWYAVGCYYDLIGKSDPARRYLSKATTLDRLYGPAWLAYGHSFAKENEHDQAMAAYFKATQLMRGCHLPLLYIGVECGLTKNLEMAEKFFYQAMSIAPLDVYVLYEVGVMKFEYELYESAEEVFQTTLDMVQAMAKQNNEPIATRWEPLLNSLGHCCRKNKKYEEALNFHRRALFLKPLSASTYTAIGFVQSLMGNLEEAVDAFHKSLSLKRDDVFTTTILKTVIEDLCEETPLPLSISESTEELSESQGMIIVEKQDDSKYKTSSNLSVDQPALRLKLKFDEYDSNISPSSDVSGDDMSLDL